MEAEAGCVFRGARHLCGIPQVEGRIVRSNHLPTPAGQLCSAALEYEEQIEARTEDRGNRQDI